MKKPKQLSLLPPQVVKKSNLLCQCSWSLASVWEARLVALVATKIRKSDKDFQPYEIPVSEIMAHTGGTDYREIEEMADRAMSRVITMKDENGWTKYNLFGRLRYNKNEGTVTVRFDPDLKPHYLNLQRDFATYNLVEFITLTSVYSQRLYEILKSFDHKKEERITVEDLHEMVSAPLSYRKNFGKFREKVLEVARKEINEKTKIKFNYDTIRIKRRIHSVIFFFEEGYTPEEKQKGKIKEGDIYQTTKKNNGQYWQYKVASDGTASPIQGAMYSLSQYDLESQIKEGLLRKIRKK